jgi:uncharacterized short protein YbdD (DUF466 family)
MWRQSGNLVSYLYYPTKTGNCGQDFAWKGAGLSSEYQTITVYVKVNDPGEYLSTKTEFHVFCRNFRVQCATAFIQADQGHSACCCFGC